MHVVRLTLLRSLVVLAAACGERPETPTVSPEVVIAREGLSLGSLDDGPEAFGRITGLTEDSAGRIYVADY